MPVFHVTGPDGHIYEVNAPEGTTEQDAIAYAQKNMAATSEAVKPEPSMLDNLRFRAGQLNTGAVQGLAGLADSVIDFPKNLYNLGRIGAGIVSGSVNDLTGGRVGTSFGDQAIPGNFYNPEAGVYGTKSGNLSVLSNAAHDAGLIDDKYAPKDLQGRALNFTGNVIGGGGLLPTGEGNAIKSAILPSIGAFAGQEAAHQIAPDSPMASIAGTLAGGFAGGLPKLVRPTINSTASRIIGDATPEQLDQARRLTATGQVTAPEALSYVTGSTAGPKIQRTLEGTAGGSEVLGPYMAQRTPANAQQIAQLADQISPDMAVRDPSRTGEFVQQAAAQRIKQEAAARTAAVKPFYDMAKTENLSPGQVTDIASSLANSAMEQGPNTKIGQMLMQRARQLMGGVSGAPETNVGRLDTLHDEMVTQANPGTFDPNQLSTKQSAMLNAGASDLQKALRTSKPYDQGQKLYAALTRNKVSPLQNSPVGQLADVGVEKTPQTTFNAVKNTLFPENPSGVVNPDTLAYTANELKKTNPSAIPDMLRQHIQNTWDEANKFIRGETPQFSGARFAQTMAGNQQSADNLMALVRGASGNQAADGLSIALDRMKAQGTRLGEGSPTALNQQTMTDLSGGGLSQLTKPKAALNEFVDKMRLAKNSKELAQVITSPDGIDQLQNIAKNTRQRLPDLLQRGALVGNAANLPEVVAAQSYGTGGQ